MFIMAHRQADKTNKLSSACSTKSLVSALPLRSHPTTGYRIVFVKQAALASLADLLQPGTKGSTTTSCQFLVEAQPPTTALSSSG